MRTVPGATDHVVVVGAGLSGLAAALHLLGAGRRVTLVERDAGPGGRAGRLELGGYRVDTGPTVLTMPHLADEAFAAVGDSLHRRVELIPLHPAYRARFADGTGIDVHTDGDAMEAEVRSFAGDAEAAGYRRLRRWLERLYRAQMSRFIDTNFDSPFQLLHPDLARLAALGASAGSIRRSADSSATRGCAGSSPSRRSTRESPRPAPSPPTPSSPTWTRSRESGSRRAA